MPHHDVLPPDTATTGRTVSDADAPSEVDELEVVDDLEREPVYDGEEPADLSLEPDLLFVEAPPELIAERDGVDITSYRLPPFPHPLQHPLRAIGWTIRAAFGIVSLVLLLAVIAAIPIVNFLTLGYLLEVEARVARTGRLRDAFLLLDVAPRIGSIALGIWLWILPLRALAAGRGDAYFINPGGPADQAMSFLTPVIALFVATHICLALARGGSLSCFFRPIKNIRWIIERQKNSDYMTHATAGVQDFVRRLRLKHHFMLGLKGFGGAFLWLLLPTLLFAAANPERPATVLLSFIGGIMLMFVLSWLPFLQARFAVVGQWRAMFDLRTIRVLFAYAPIAWLCAIAVLYTLSLPLNLPKIFLLPQDAMWTITLVFVVTIYPAKVMTGWALHRAVAQRESPWFGWRWLSRWLMVPLLGLYVFLFFFTPYISEHGKSVLFENHALLLPVPF